MIATPESIPGGAGARPPRRGRAETQPPVPLPDRPGEWGLFVWFLRLVLPYRGLIAIAMVCLAFGTAAQLSQPLLVKAAIDGPIADRQPERLIPIVVIYLVTVLAHGVFFYGQHLASVTAGQRAVDEMRRRLFERAVSFRPSYYDRTPVGAVLTRITNDTEALHEAIASGIVTSFASMAVLIGAVVGMFVVAGWWALAALAALPFLVIVLGWIRLKLKECFERIRGLTRAINEFLEERLSGMAVVQAFAAEDRTLSEFDLKNEDKLDVEITSTTWHSVLSSVIQLASLLSVAAIVAAAGWARAGAEGAADGAAVGISLGALIALIDYLERFYRPFEDLSGKYAIFQRAFVSLEKIAGLLGRDELVDIPDDPAPVEPLRDEIVWDDVRFQYANGKEVVHGVTLRLRHGESLALVGATGAGKTTLARLLGRFYDVTEGRVTWDGRDVRDHDPADLRARLAYVPQDVFLFSRSLADNITLDDASPDRDRMRHALETALASEVVDGLPDGIDTVVGERGQDLSAGERQLLAMARALYRDPSVLVLDEATSSVDLQTEARIRDAMRSVAKGRTTLIIAHRLATAREADRIGVIVGGKLAEIGSHEELIRGDGVYAGLWRAATDAVGEGERGPGVAVEGRR